MGTIVAIHIALALLAAFLMALPPSEPAPECDREAVEVECDEAAGGEH